MLKNYFKVAFRNLNRNRVYALINILGLALGLTVTILVFMFVKDETSYDKHWSDSDRIYRTGIKADMMGQKMDAPVSPSPMAQALRTEFQDVEAATRLNTVRKEILMRHEQTKVYVQKGVYVDSTFFSVFDYSHFSPLRIKVLFRSCLFQANDSIFSLAVIVELPKAIKLNEVKQK